MARPVSRRGRRLRASPGLIHFSSHAKCTYDFDVLLPRHPVPCATEPRLTSADCNAGERTWEPESSRTLDLCCLSLFGCLRTSRVISAQFFFVEIQEAISPLKPLTCKLPRITYLLDFT